MKPRHRYIMPSDYTLGMHLELNRAEVITLLNALVNDIEAYAAKGESIQSLDLLAEKVEERLREGEPTEEEAADAHICGANAEYTDNGPAGAGTYCTVCGALVKSYE